MESWLFIPCFHLSLNQWVFVNLDLLLSLKRELGIKSLLTTHSSSLSRLSTLSPSLPSFLFPCDLTFCKWYWFSCKHINLLCFCIFSFRYGRSLEQHQEIPQVPTLPTQSSLRRSKCSLCSIRRYGCPLNFK